MRHLSFTIFPPTPTETPTATPTQPVNTFTGAAYTYDGDGNMVKSVIDGVTTYYVGGYYELKVEGEAETEVKYYYAASLRIAMRTDGILNWLFSDHLSSTTIVTDESGTVVSEMKYTAFGEIRSDTGTNPTDYLYTGQRYEAEFGLSYYVARWYDGSLNQFIQPDTLIPDPGNAADWNRYAYVNYNPIRYNDPTGHSGDNPWDDDPIDYLFEFANKQLARVASQDINDLDAMVLIVDESAKVYDGDLDRMMPTLTEIFLGTTVTGTFALPVAAMNTGFFGGGCAGVGRSHHDCPSNEFHFGDSGFNEDFQDGDNQLFHVWGYIAQTYSENLLPYEINMMIGITGNIYHEIGQSILNQEDGWGTSWNDYTLSEAGMSIGLQLTFGKISGDNLGNVLKERLGVNGPGSDGRVQKYIKWFGPLKGMEYNAE